MTADDNAQHRLLGELAQGLKSVANSLDQLRDEVRASGKDHHARLETLRAEVRAALGTQDVRILGIEKAREYERGLREAEERARKRQGNLMVALAGATGLGSAVLGNWWPAIVEFLRG